MEQHRLAGQVVSLKVNGKDPDCLNGASYRIEDWWINVAGKSWMFCDGNPACLKYAMRLGMAGLPTDDKVLYGKVGHLGHLIHETELDI